MENTTFLGEDEAIQSLVHRGYVWQLILLLWLTFRHLLRAFQHWLCRGVHRTWSILHVEFNNQVLGKLRRVQCDFTHLYGGYAANFQSLGRLPTYLHWYSLSQHIDRVGLPR